MVKLKTWSPRSDLEGFTPFGRDPFFRRLYNLMDPELEEGTPWMPAMNVYESKQELFVHVDVPGMDPDDIEINLQGQTLTIRGERKAPESGEGMRPLRTEQGYGEFQRTLQLPIQVDPEKVSAKADRGVMTITLPKSKQYVGRQIPITHK